MATKIRTTSSPNSTRSTSPSSRSSDNDDQGSRTSFRAEPEYLETELAFRDAEAQIEELRRKMYELTVLRGLDMNWLDVVHPLLLTAIPGGTFYAASAPGAKPFVQIGDACKPDTVVGILEIGTIPNQIAAQYHGYVAEIIAKDGQAVKYGEPLLRLVRLPPSTASTRKCS